MWAILAVLSAVFAALTSIFAKVGIQNVDSTLATAVRTVVVVLMAWAMVFITHTQSGLSGIDRKAGYFLSFRDLRRVHRGCAITRRCSSARFQRSYRLTN